MRSIAHIRASDKQVQTVEEHLLGVRKLAEKYGAKLGVKHVTGLAGMLHDMGKYTEEFADYILAAVAANNTSVSKPKRGSVDHSTAGGKLLYDLFHGDKSPYRVLLAEIVGNAIISHHSYLKDFLGPALDSDYLKRVVDKELKEYERSKQTFYERVHLETELIAYVDQAAVELEQYLNKGADNEPLELQLMFLTKFTFSALIDADRTNTRGFEMNLSDEPELDITPLFHTYYDRLLKKVHTFQSATDEATLINKQRHEMSERCDQMAEQMPGIRTLSIPTGGGKTFASLRYALKHAFTFHKKRIIYIVPYTTIIEQNAAEIRKIVEDDTHILEHHSNVVHERRDPTELPRTDNEDQALDGLAITEEQKLELVKDNWDAPIIFTTMVQFLNVFFSRSSRNIRRLHNVCEAVLIFDEVQKVPTSCVSLFNLTLNFLQKYGGSSIVLCTATQPALDFVEHKLDLKVNAEMIPNIDDVNRKFKRVNLVDKATGQTFTTDKLAQFVHDTIRDVKSVLIILNTKAVVKALYEQLGDHIVDEQGTVIRVYHLSTYMCAAHRQAVLEQVKQHLANKEKVICVSTPLIEAGVDISFACVIRSLAGLDSIAQAAGRCNRHREQDIQQVYIIDHAEENLKQLQEIRIGKAIVSVMLKDMMCDPNAHGGDLLSHAAMSRYFQEYYTERASDLDYTVPKLGKSLTSLLFAYGNDTDGYYQAYVQQKKKPQMEDAIRTLCLKNSYGTAAEHFKVIEDLTTPVLVPYGKGEAIIAELNGGGTIDELSDLLRSAQPYTVNLYEYDVRKLDLSGGISRCLDGKVFVLKEGAYDVTFGVDVENESGIEFLNL
ncbi:CRISPR-associated helicase/endonuclease Cas3 [Paenibacillus taiwanensis]|uniref:CRISPR-associated helicase/endonuclease Cas3 n=1 Tax=Paenibacillus taiwanensis TaxID=401638 RepID=UPI0004000ED8|nr:CRISPR-associated helicase/endonuclease Cas3 [Paenibacillus taiwanensis]